MASPHPFRLARAILFALIFAVNAATALRNFAAEVPNEYELKSVMILNLARFVEWPSNAFANSDSPMVIGVLGHNPFGDNLEKAVKGEIVNGHPFVVEYYDSLRSIKTCHILYICLSEKSNVASILSKIKGQPTLSVSELEGFSNLPGGMVRFYTNDQKKIRLRLNLDSARSEGLRVSSKLIQVAEIDHASLSLPPRAQISGSGLSDVLLLSLAR